jgi:hypothetical protein
MSNNPLYSWLRKEGHWIAKNANTAPTHVFLDGGKAHIPPSAIPAFFKLYTECVKAGDTQYAVERIQTDRFRMFVDLDLQPQVDHRRIAKLVTRAVSEVLLESDQSSAVVACMKLSDESKGGLHLIWEHVLVDSDIARMVRKEAINRLAEADGSLDWPNVYDETVYRGTGLRMIMSMKKPGAPEGSEYVPCAVLDRDGGFVQDQVQMSPDLLSWVRRCSVQAPVESSKGVIDLTTSASMSQASKSSTNRGSYTSSVAADLTTDQENELMDCIPIQYQPCRVTHIHQCGTMYLLATNSRFCANLGRQHNSNHVYFVVNDKGVHQKCHCACNTTSGRRKGLCADFSERVADAPKFVVEAANRKTIASFAKPLMNRSDVLARQLAGFRV